jgi:hypothetical protein
MKRPIVVNIKTEPCDHYIGRRTVFGPRQLAGSPFGNPFRISTEAERAGAIERYAAHLLARDDLLIRLHEFEGKRIGCWCSPLPCHGDVIADFVQAIPIGLKPRVALINALRAEHSDAEAREIANVKEWSELTEAAAIRGLILRWKKENPKPKQGELFG